MIVISEDQTTTIDATFLESWIIDTGVTVAIPSLGIDASGAVSGREFIVKGTLRSEGGPAMRLGDAGLADSATAIRVDHLGAVVSGGRGLVALSGGVTFEVAGDATDAGRVRTSGTALDFRQGGNTIRNDGTIRSTAGTAILSDGAADDIENNGTLDAHRHAIVSAGDDLAVRNNGTLSAEKGYGILSSGAGLSVENAGLLTARRDAISASGDGASIVNYATIRSANGAGIASSGADAVIGNTTLVKGATAGILSTGDGATITNSGTVRSAGTGIEASGDGSTVDTTAKLIGKVGLVIGGEGSIATNLNEIHGTGRNAAAVRLIGREDVDFTNHGAVFARSGVAIAAGKGDNGIENTGSLHGHVRLGAGDDWFSALVGEVKGKVHGGRGDDVYEAGIRLRIVEKAGEGNDTVKAMFTWTLGANIENLELMGGADADATGNGLHNVLTGNSGDNRFWGLSGRDIFVMRTGGGSDTIMDFADGRDRIDFRDVAGIDTFADIAGHMRQAGRHVVIDLSDKAADLVLTVRKADLGHLAADDFLF